MERKLASIQVIKDLQPIEGADKIEKAIVLGWELVVKKGDFKVGDMCVYCEVDSIMPEKPEFEFLRDVKFRIKTRKMRKQISQGICFPMNILPEGSYNIGDDVTEVLGVTKYEIPEVTNGFGATRLGKAKRRNFPSFIPKIDEIRVQAVPEVLNELVGKDIYVAIKYDGTSFTCWWKDGEFGVASRNCGIDYHDPVEWKEKAKAFLRKIFGNRRWLQPDRSQENVYCEVARKYNIKNTLDWFGHNVAIQGEIIGPNVQGNKLELKELELKVFNIYDLDTGKFLDYDELVRFTRLYGLEMVEVPIFMKSMDRKTVNDLVELTKSFKYANGAPIEGLVFRPSKEMYSNTLKGRCSFKVINPEFLLKYDC